MKDEIYNKIYSVIRKNKIVYTKRPFTVKCHRNNNKQPVRRILHATRNTQQSTIETSVLTFSTSILNALPFYFTNTGDDCRRSLSVEPLIFPSQKVLNIFYYRKELSRLLVEQNFQIKIVKLQ